MKHSATAILEDKPLVQGSRHVEVPSIPQCLCLLQISQAAGSRHGAVGPQHHRLHLVCSSTSSVWAHDGQRCTWESFWCHSAGPCVLRPGRYHAGQVHMFEQPSLSLPTHANHVCMLSSRYMPATSMQAITNVLVAITTPHHCCRGMPKASAQQLLRSCLST